MIIENKKLLQEFLFSNDMKQYDTLFGQAVYSSEKLKNDLKDMIEQSHLKPVKNKLDWLIDNNILLPCYTSKNFLQYLKNKIFSNMISKYAYGIYVKENQKIFIFMANAKKYFFFSNKDKIIETITHELMHYCAHKKTSQFISLFKKDLQKYYQTFYEFTFNEKDVLNSSNLNKLIAFLFHNFELKKELNYSALYDYARFLDKNINFKDQNEKQEIINHTLAVLKIYLQSPPNFINTIKYNKNTQNVIQYLFSGYKSINVYQKPDTIPIQELIYPSEIIAIKSMIDFNNKHMSILKSI